jgi:hypothetical protein
MDAEILGTLIILFWITTWYAKRNLERRNNRNNVSIYRRNLQRAYIERMEYLMKEEIKPSRSEIITMYHNLMCALVEGEK